VKIVFFLSILAFVLLGGPLFGQTADRLEEILGKPVLNWGDAAIFTLEASDQAVFSGPDEAFSYAMERKWLPKNAQIDESARLNGVALLFMRAFNLKGGIFYTLAKTPHTAYRELAYREVIQGRTDPDMQVSGADFLFMLGRILSIEDDTPTGLVETEDGLVATTEADAQWLAAQTALANKINDQLVQVTDTSARVTNQGVTIRISNIQFLANSSDLPDSEKAKLRDIAGILSSIPDKRILVAGHTALAGTRSERQRTSLERAQAVASYLVTLGARKAGEITVRGYGSDRPIAVNNTPEGMAMNRRVEITILDNQE